MQKQLFVKKAGSLIVVFFFFQAEDGIRDVAVTGVQTCALPIYVNIVGTMPTYVPVRNYTVTAGRMFTAGDDAEIGRASCRGRGEISVGAVLLKKKKKVIEKFCRRRKKMKEVK